MPIQLIANAMPRDAFALAPMSKNLMFQMAEEGLNISNST